MTQDLVILGSTGSIGTQALDVCDKLGIRVSALTASKNSGKLEEQIRKYHPHKAALLSEDAAADLRVRIADTDTAVLSGTDGICECARSRSADTVLNAIVGIAGLLPTLEAIDASKTIALANKETLVAGGELVMRKAAENGVKIYPVDSEHSAIFQSMHGNEDRKYLKKIILTASGGPFFGKTREELENVRLKDALVNPNWSMGDKITIDSATMMNKGLEVIEACRLFDVTPDMIDVVVHRQSILHSAVVFADNAVIAQMGVPDMRIPIQFALTYPERFESPVNELDLTSLASLTFEKPDTDTFDCLAVCIEAAKRGGLYPAAANSGNEQANYLFRQGRIGFLEIGQLAAAAMEAAGDKKEYSLSDILMTDRLSRDLVSSMVPKGGSYYIFS